jgi:O-antigen ligase
MKKITEVLLFLYLAFYPFGQLTRLPLKIGEFPEVNFYLTDLLVGILGVIGVIRGIRAVGKKKLPLLAKPMLIFLGITAFSLLVNIPFFEGKEILVGGLYWLRLAAYFGVYFWINLSDWSDWSNLSDLLLVSGGAVAVFGLIQYFAWPDLTSLKYIGWDPHYYRLAGTFLDPNFTGIILVLTIILLISKFKPSIIHYSLFFILYLSLALTYSRASWLAFLGGVGSWFWLKKRKKGIGAIILIIIIIAITAAVLPRGPGGEGVRLERTSSVLSRVGSWQQALIIAKDKPIFGVGFNTYRYAQKKYGFLGEDWQTSHSGGGVDNSFLFVLATSGILGLVGLLGLLGKIFALSFRKSPLVFASLVAILIHSLFNNTLFYPWVMGWLVIILKRL